MVEGGGSVTSDDGSEGQSTLGASSAIARNCSPPPPTTARGDARRSNTEILAAIASTPTPQPDGVISRLGKPLPWPPSCPAGGASDRPSPGYGDDPNGGLRLTPAKLGAALQQSPATGAEIGPQTDRYQRENQDLCTK